MKTIAQDIFEKGIKKGRREGRREGRQEGRQEGRIEIMVSSIVKVLESKKIKTTMQIRKRLAEIQDEVILDSFFQSALTCSSLKDFEADLAGQVG